MSSLRSADLMWLARLTLHLGLKSWPTQRAVLWNGWLKECRACIPERGDVVVVWFIRHSKSFHLRPAPCPCQRPKIDRMTSSYWTENVSRVTGDLMPYKSIKVWWQLEITYELGNSLNAKHFGEKVRRAWPNKSGSGHAPLRDNSVI